jgi:HK97 gp10 family phage protein
MPARFVPNRAGLEKFLRSDRMRNALQARCERAAVYARQIAPVDTGRYAYARAIPQGESGGGFHVTSGTAGGRAYARLVNDTPYAYFLEFGTRYMEARKTLRKSIDAMRSR